jgi:UDPglucose 6-dehydrogenase
MDYLESRTSEKNANAISSFDSPYDACKNAHAIAVLTEWDEFVQYDWQKIYDGMQKPAFVFDGRNILDRTALEAIGFEYQGIGS